MKLYSPQECMDFWQNQRPIRNGKTIWISIERCIECAIKQDITARELSNIRTDIAKHDEAVRAEERGKMLMPYDVESVEELVANVRSKTIDEVIKTLAQNVDTIWSVRQYHELLKMKGGTEDEND